MKPANDDDLLTKPAQSVKNKVFISAALMMILSVSLFTISHGLVRQVGERIHPLVATLGAVLFMGEPARIRRWVALAIGLAGAILIIRPGFRPLSPATGLFCFQFCVLPDQG